MQRFGNNRSIFENKSLASNECLRLFESESRTERSTNNNCKWPSKSKL